MLVCIVVRNRLGDIMYQETFRGTEITTEMRNEIKSVLDQFISIQLTQSLGTSIRCVMFDHGYSPANISTEEFNI